MRHNLVRWIKKWRMEFAVGTVIIYLLAIPFTVWIFPDNNMWLGLLVLFSGFTAALATLADLLVSSEKNANNDS